MNHSHSDIENGTINPVIKFHLPDSLNLQNGSSSHTTNKPTIPIALEMSDSNNKRNDNKNYPPRETIFDNLSGIGLNRDTFQKLTNFKLVRLLQYLCFVISLSGSIYFLSKQYINVSLQYFQICFISTLTVCLDAESWYKQRIFFVLSYLVACVWAMALLWAGYKYLSWKLYNYITGGFCLFFFLHGMLGATYVALLVPAEVKYVELDLLLYLVSLNAICFFRADDEFNNNLHMILDIRTIVLLYTSLHQPKQKMELLNSVSFISIMVLIVIVFILYASNTDITNAIGYSLYTIIGILLMYEAYASYQRFKQKYGVEKRLDNN